MTDAQQGHLLLMLIVIATMAFAIGFAAGYWQGAGDRDDETVFTPWNEGDEE